MTFFCNYPPGRIVVLFTVLFLTPIFFVGISPGLALISALAAAVVSTGFASGFLPRLPFGDPGSGGSPSRAELATLPVPDDSGGGGDRQSTYCDSSDDTAGRRGRFRDFLAMILTPPLGAVSLAQRRPAAA